MRIVSGLGPMAAPPLLLVTPADSAAGVDIGDLVVTAIPDARRDADLKAVRTFYGFWDSGDVAFLKQALAEDLTDRTLPPGRP